MVARTISPYKGGNEPGRLRVLVVTTSFPLPGGPPSGPFIQRLAASIAGMTDTTVLVPCIGGRQDYVDTPGYRVTCFRYAPISWQKLAHSPGGIPVSLKSNPLLYLLLPWFLVSLGVACWRVSSCIDLIHANWSVNGVMAGLIAKLRKKPLVTTLRGEDITRSGTSPMFRWLLKTCVHLSDRIVVVSDAFKNSVKQQLPECAWKVIVIPNGVERTLLNREIEGGEKGILNLISVGSLIPRKNVSTLIKALARMPNQDSVNLVIVGDGIERVSLERLVSEVGLGSSVKFTGSVPQDVVTQYLNSSDAMVLSSLSEGRPNVVLEAMAAGVTVVATAIDGVTELIQDGETGLLFEPDDVEGLADHLERLRADVELRRRLSLNARASILRQKLFWDSTGKKYVDVYQQCLGRSG